MADLGADSLRKLGIVGRDARQDFRRHQDATYPSVVVNRQKPGDNPAQRILDQMADSNWHPRTPSDKRRYERLQVQANTRDALLKSQHQAELDQLKREADPDYQQAKEVYARHVAGAPIEDPGMAKHYAMALGHLEEGDYGAMYKSLNRASEAALERSDAALREIEAKKAEIDQEHARRHMIDAKLHLATLTPNRPFTQPSEGTTAGSSE